MRTNASESPKLTRHYWEYPIHFDSSIGLKAGATLLIVVDAYSKWVEVKQYRKAPRAETGSLILGRSTCAQLYLVKPQNTVTKKAGKTTSIVRNVSSHRVSESTAFLEMLAWTNWLV